jgi:predicted SAM-dependent methyltransferase
MCDVIEHVLPVDEPLMMDNVHDMLKPGGIFVAGCPSLESQVYASEISKAGHVNCRSGDKLRQDMLRYFDNVFLFGMNDEVLHTGYPQMCHYLFAVCTGPKR